MIKYPTKTDSNNDQIISKNSFKFYSNNPKTYFKSTIKAQYLTKTISKSVQITH